MNKFIAVEISGNQTIINMEQITSVEYSFKNKSLLINLTNNRRFKSNYQFFTKLEKYINKFSKFIEFYDNYGTKILINVNHISDVIVKNEYKNFYITLVNNISYNFPITDYDKIFNACLEY